MTFILAGGGHFKPGIVDFQDQASDVDLYNTVTQALGITEPFGDMSWFTGTLPGVV